MQIVYDAPFVFFPNSSKLANALVLRASMDYLVTLNRIYLSTAKQHGYPVPGLYQSGIRYGRTQVWDTIQAALQRRHADCKTLSAWLIAELQERGFAAQPEFRWNPRPSGERDFHILVMTEKGIRDPSKDFGMGADEAAYFSDSWQ
jgi:hypothetical protein